MDGSISDQTVNEEWGFYQLFVMDQGPYSNGDLNSCIVKWVMPADYCVLMKNYE